MVYANRPDLGFYLSFEDPNDPAVTPTYVDFTCLFKSASAVARGRQYELGQTLAADPDVVLRDVNEYLNSANNQSPHYPNVDSYRRVLWMGTWPNTPIGNLFNPAYWGITGTVDPNLGPRDPSFESYTVGTTVPWISNIGAVNSVVSNSGAHSGTQCLTYAVAGSTTRQGIAFDMRCMPGRYYTISVYLTQTSASLQQIIVDSPVGSSTSTTGAYVRLTQTFLATAPEHICFVLTTGTAVAGTVRIDDIQMEQQPALNANINFQFADQHWTPHGGTVLQNNQFYKVPEFSLRLKPDGVSATPYFESDRATSVAVAGQQYTASGWIYTQTGSSNQVDIRVNWYTSGNVLISNPAGSPSVISTGQWTFFTTTFTAPATTGFVTVLGTILGTPTTGTVFYFDQVQVVSTTPSAFTTSGPTIYPIMANFAERFQKYWEDGEYTGKVQIPCVDALTALSATKIPTEFTTAMTKTAPDYWWPLSNGGSTGQIFPEIHGATAMTPGKGKGSPFTGTVSGGAATGIVGDPGSTGVSIGGSTATNQGNNLFANHLVIPSWGTSWAVTASVWASFTDVTNVFGLFALSNKNGNMAGVLRGGTADLHLFAGTVYTPIAGGTSTPDTPFNYTGGGIHHYVMTATLAANSFTLRLYVDGAQIVTNTATASTAFGTSSPFFGFNTMELSSGNFGYDAGDGISGTYAHAAIWRRELSPTEISTLFQAGSVAFSGETSGTRVARHFAIGQYPAPYRISTNTTSIMGPPSYTGLIDLGSDTQNTTIAEGGNFWIAPDGAPVFESRQDRFLRLTPLWTLGNGAGNPHFAEPEYDVDPTYVYATVQVARSGGGTLVGGSAADVATAVKKYFGRTFTATVDIQTDAAAQDMANFVFYTHNHTLQRIAALTLDPASNPALWSLVLGIEIGNRVRVIFTSPAANGGTGFTNNADFFVENVTHGSVDMDAGTWTTTLLMSPIGNPFGTATLQPFILDNINLGVLNLNILGW